MNRHNFTSFFPIWMLCLVTQSYLILCNPMDFVARQDPLSMEILWARILVWVLFLA